MDIIRLLAVNELTQKAIAERYGVQQSAVSSFSRRYADRIAEVRAELDNALAGLWIAKKENRVAHYMDMAEESDDVNLDADWNERRRVKAAALRAVADELGQIPNRSTVTVDQTVRFEVSGAEDV
jgi:predicted transcriptional regulator